VLSRKLICYIPVLNKVHKEKLNVKKEATGFVFYFSTNTSFLTKIHETLQDPYNAGDIRIIFPEFS
jgi:hypothetical protein